MKLMRAGGALLSRQAERTRVARPREERAPRRPYSGPLAPKVGFGKAGEGLFVRECRDRTRSNGFKLKKDRLRLDKRKKSFTMRVVRH